MLNRRQALCLAAAFIAFFSASVHADDGISYPAKIAGKFGIGLMNAATGIVEIPKTMTVESQQEGIGMGLSAGLLKGLVNMLGRTFLGAADMVSFPIPTKPLINPPVVFQNFSEPTTYGSGWETY